MQISVDHTGNDTQVATNSFRDGVWKELQPNLEMYHSDTRSDCSNHANKDKRNSFHDKITSYLEGRFKK